MKQSTPLAGQASHALTPKPPLAVVPMGKGHTVPTEPAEAAGPADRLQRVRRLAYARYEARGRAEGQALDDWLQAEAELTTAERTAAAAASLHAG